MENNEARPDNVSARDLEPPTKALFDSAYKDFSSFSSTTTTDTQSKNTSTLPSLEITDLEDSDTMGAVFTSDTSAARAPKPADKVDTTALKPEHVETLKKYESASPSTAKALREAARETVKAIKEGLEGKGPASDASKAKALEALNKLGDSVRGIKGPDGRRISPSEQAKLVEAALTREMASGGLKGYEAIKSPVRPRSGEFHDFRIEKRNEKEGDKSMRITVPFNKFASGERSDAAGGDVGIKTKSGYKTLDSWVKPRK